MRKRPATRPVWWARKLSSLRGPAPTSGGPRPAPRLMGRQRASGSQVDASDPDFPFGEGNDRPTADAHTRCIPGRAPPTATRRRRSMGGPCRAMRGRRTTWLSNGIESVVNHVRPVRCVVRVWCDQSDVVGSRRPGRPARALRIPAAHRVVQVAARASHAASKSCISPIVCDTETAWLPFRPRR